MSLSSASIPIGGSYSPTGGSATVFKSLGQTSDSNKLFVDDGSVLPLRKTVLATSRPPTPNASAPNGYTQQRTSISFHVPILLDNGKYTTNTVRVEMSYDIETDTTERAFLRELLAHLGSDADFDSLFNDGSVV